MNWITTNWVYITSTAAAIVIIARLIVKLTPTPKDDTFLEHLVEVCKHLGLHIDKDDTTPPTPPTTPVK